MSKDQITKTLIAVFLLTMWNLTAGCGILQTEARNQETIEVKNNGTENEKPVNNPIKSTAKLAADDLQVVNDPTKDIPQVTVSPSSTAFIKKTLEPKLKKLWSDETCTEEFKIINAADGSFTRDGAVQTAYLYEYCEGGETTVNSGIAVFENSQPVKNIVFTAPEPATSFIAYDGGYASGLKGLKDINRNGTDELVVYYGYYNSGSVSNFLDIVEISGGSVEVLGSIFVDHQNTREETGYRITVKPGKTPVFYSETFEKKGKSLVKTEPSKMFKVEKDTQNEYRVVE